MVRHRQAGHQSHCHRYLTTSQPWRLPIASFAQPPFYDAQPHLRGASFLTRFRLNQSLEIESSMDGHGVWLGLAVLRWLGSAGHALLSVRQQYVR